MLIPVDNRNDKHWRHSNWKHSISARFLRKFPKNKKEKQGSIKLYQSLQLCQVEKNSTQESTTCGYVYRKLAFYFSFPVQEATFADDTLKLFEIHEGDCPEIF